jgi:hypothetical protein
MAVKGHGERHEDGRRDEPGSALAAARGYVRRGWQVVPLAPGTKHPCDADWPQMRLAEAELPAHFVGARNVGLLTGVASGGLVDVDCDVPEASAAAALLLPPTGLVHERAGRPASHFWYVVAQPGERGADGRGTEGPARGERGGALPVPGEELRARLPIRTARFACPFPAGADVPATTTMLVELRADGCQTMAPPSIHPCGERLRWERMGAPAVVDEATLWRAVAQVAACALLARCWPARGTRDEAALALTGLLLRRGGWTVEAAERFVSAVAKVAGDEEWRQRGAKGRHTAERLAAGQPVLGGTALAARLRGGANCDGVRVVAQVRAWLSLVGPRPETGSGGGDPLFFLSPDAPDPDLPSCPADAFAITREDDHEGAIWTRRQVTGGLSVGVRLANVREERVRWLWPGRLPLGKLTLLDGDPGLGKSLVTIDLAARVSVGQAMPDGAPGLAGPAGVVLLSAEDGLGDTIVPRLRAAGANLERVMALRTLPELDTTTGAAYERAVVLPRDVPALATAAREVGACLLVIDPLMAYLDPRVNSWRDQDARATLAPLAGLAEALGLAVLILRHLTKGSGGSNALYRGGGSIGIIGAARSGLLVAKDPDDPEHSRVLASSKSNLGPPMPSLRYEVETLPDTRARIVWRGASPYSAAPLLAAPPDTDTEALSALEEAKAWLRQALAAGPRDGADVRRGALAVGIRGPTLRRAREQVCAPPERAGFAQTTHALWALRPDPDLPSCSSDPFVINSTCDHEGQDDHEGRATPAHDPPGAQGMGERALADVRGSPATGTSHE